MLISLNWLKKFVEVPKGYDPADLASKLTMSTVEVEGVLDRSKNLDGVVVGEILEIKKHPNADKLSIAQINVGKEKRQIVFGQMVKMEVGNKIPVALAPTVLPGGVEIKESKLRGELSQGMLCLDQELGLLKEGVSIQFFDKSVANGTPIIEALNLNDVVLEVDHKSLTHRPDLWSHYGLARELASILKVKFNDYEVPKIKSGRKYDLTVEIEDKDKCQRYIGVVVGNIKIAPSPDWLKRSLEAVGVRAINNVVDITNYVMLELGNPLHAFDWRQIEGKKIVVATAAKGEKFTTLDNIERQLDEEMLLIKDGKKAVALAGVMGGLNSEIKDDTTTILLESANFKGSNIRQTSMKLGLRTEGSVRWEKGISPFFAELAARKAVAMILELCPGAKVASKVVDQNYYEFKQPEIELDLDWLTRFLGVNIAKEEVADILTRLQFSVKEKKKGWLLVKVPFWRATGDVSLPEDLAEEVIRIYGYQNIKSVMPQVYLNSPDLKPQRQLERQVKNILVGAGLTEVYNYSFVDKNKISDLGLNPEDPLFISLKNALSEEQGMLRMCLSVNLLKNVVDNLRFYNSLQLFELGRVFLNMPGEDSKRVGSEDKLPWQHTVLSGVIVEVGNDRPFYRVKGLVEGLLSELGYDYRFGVLDNLPSFMEAARSQRLEVAGQPIGQIGEFSRAVTERLGLKATIGLFELDFTKLAVSHREDKKYQPLLKNPTVVRDLAILVDRAISWEEIRKIVKKVGGELVRDIEIFDVYEGDKIAADKRSLAFHLTYYSVDKTLASEEVESVEKKIINELEKKFGAKVR